MTALEKIHQTNTLNLREMIVIVMVTVVILICSYVPHLVKILNPNRGIKAQHCADGEICHLIHPSRLCFNIF